MGRNGGLGMDRRSGELCLKASNVAFKPGNLIAQLGFAVLGTKSVIL